MVAGARGGGGSGGESRAVDAVHSQPVFRTPVMARAESHSGRVAERWAPEGQSAARAPAMRSLGFADRMIVNYLGGGPGEQAGLRAGGAARRGGSVARQVAPMDWLFPIPWYLDELDWVSAARAAAWESERAAVRSGEAAARPRASESRGEVAARREAAAARAEVRPEVRFDLPLELVAPSLAAARASERSSGGRTAAAAARQAAAPAWRAYSPMVDPAAARAAEFLAELVERSAPAGARPAAESGSAAAGDESAAPMRPAPILEYVAPSELAGPAGSPGSVAEAQRARVASAARQTLDESRQAQAAAVAQAQAIAQAQSAAAAQATAQARSQAQAVARAQGEAEAAARGQGLAGGADAARAAEQARAASAEAQALEAARAEQVARAEQIEAEQAIEETRRDAARQGAVQSERARREALRIAEDTRVAEVARSEVARAEAYRGDAARAEAVRAEAARAEAARAASEQPGAVPPASAARRAVELLAMSALAGGESIAPSAGPRVVMPAGLGGLVAASRTSRAVHQPVSGGAAPRSERGGRAPRGWSFASSRPAALDHLLWSDRWLARFAGASGGALRSFDVARGGVSVRAGAAAEWQPAWVSPPPLRRAAAAMAAAAAAGRTAPERVLTAPVLDDDQPVGDDVFGAIAAAAASDRHRRQRPPRPRPAGPAAPTGPFRAPAADRALARVAMPRAAGLGPSLGASPIAALLANLLDSPTQTTFDARPLSSRSVSDFLARGAAPARPATPLAVQLVRRAPGSIWLSMPSAGPAPWRSLAPPAMAMGPASPLVAGLPDRAASGAAAASGGRAALSLVAPGADPTSAAATSAAATSALTAAAAARSPGAARAGRPALAAGPLSASLGAARPGSIAGEAESFARSRSLAVADLALDFLSPEVLVAARSFGFGPIDAVRAQRLAASGRPEMARLASMVDQVFVAALAPGQAATAQERTALAGRAATGELAEVAPHRTPRGSFLMPAASSRALGLTPGQAEQARPGIGAALDLVAAGQVAEVAAQRTGAPGGLALGSGDPGAGAATLGEVDLADPVARATLAARHRESATAERSATDAARALLPPHLWSVFDAVYLSLGEETTASDVRPLAPAARAARALALASRARGPEDLPISARARAAAAWAVLPVVLTGGATPAGSAAASAAAAVRRGRAGSAASFAGSFAGAPAGSPAGIDADGLPFAAAPAAPGGRPGASRAGTALATLVAPSFFRADERGDGYAPVSAERARAAMSTTFVETGSASRPAPRPAPAPPPAPRPAPAPAQPAAPTAAQFDAWFKDTAKKYFGEAPSSSGLTMAEMTLVTSAPRAQIAASEMTASRPTQSTTAAAPSSGPGAAPAGAGGGKPDIDKIAQDVYDQIVRMLDVARERNGDPWSR